MPGAAPRGCGQAPALQVGVMPFHAAVEKLNVLVFLISLPIINNSNSSSAIQPDCLSGGSVREGVVGLRDHHRIKVITLQSAVA